MVRLLIASLLSAVVLFFWGFVYWTVSPLRFQALKALPGQEKIVPELEKAGLETGVYLAPFVDEDRVTAENKDEVMKALLEKHKKGPLVQIIYRKDGVDMMNPTVFVMGFVHMFVSSLLVGLLLLMVVQGLSTYGSRVLFVFLASLFASWTIDLSAPIWFHHPWGYSLFNAGYHVGCGLFSALILAGLIKPRT
jgi:hypothetical protein